MRHPQLKDEIYQMRQSDFQPARMQPNRKGLSQDQFQSGQYNTFKTVACV